jgi:hypothetical protein
LGKIVKVFVSWSGERSQQLALALRDWLPLVLHFVEPWVSQSDIEAGDRWANEVGKELEASNFGVICITSENVGSPWILFEAGALSKSMQEGRVVPLLLDIEFKDVTGPLAQFQAKKLENSGLWDVLNSINRLAQNPVPEQRLKQLFDALWPELEKKVGEIPKASKQSKPNRPQQEILEELVSSIRGLDVRFREMGDDLPRARRRRRFRPFMIDEMMHMLELGRRDPMRFLLVGSFLKDDFPWLYELAVDAYHETKRGNSPRARDAQRRFAAGFQALRRGPMLEFSGDKEVYYLVNEMGHLFEEDLLQPDVTERVSRKRGTEEAGDNDSS